MLFNSIQSISNAKNLEDKYDQQIAQLNHQIESQADENKMYRTYVNETTGDRDQYRKRTLMLLESKAKLEKEKQTMMDTFKKRVMD